MNQPDLQFSDFCVECGIEVDRKLWGGTCRCGKTAVHQVPCDKCGRICGVIIDDDYCSTDVMVCPDCMDKARDTAIQPIKYKETCKTVDDLARLLYEAKACCTERLCMPSNITSQSQTDDEV